VAISKWRGYCARSSSTVRVEVVGLVESKFMEGVSGSDVMGRMREGWDGSGE